MRFRKLGVLGLMVLSLFAVTSFVTVEAEAATRKQKYPKYKKSTKKVTKKKPRATQNRKVASTKKKKKSKTNLCGDGTATTTMYNVPHIKDVCPTSKVCSKFRSAVKLNGSGTLSDGRILRYTGKIETLDNGCKTAEGSFGRCLTPFISVAADPEYYRAGDYIKMPGLKGKEITMPDGKVIKHPGFLVVEDVGSAIKGPNRFDFFTGSWGQYMKGNQFGSKTTWDEPTIADKNMCAAKKFSKVDRNTTDFMDAEEDIAKFQAEAGTSSRLLASTKTTTKGAKK